MTVSTWSGMAIADIPAEYFDEPFETWTGKLPALVLASTRTVPVSPHGQWRLASASCGGHREDIFPAAVCSWISVRIWLTWSEGSPVLLLLMSIWGTLSHCQTKNAGLY